MGHLNASVDNVERPLLTPDEVQRLKPPKKKGSGDQERIVAPGQMLIFVGGSYPILGIQMLYFFDPTFRMRAQIPPPTQFVRLRGDQILQRAPAERYLLSPPETPPPEPSHAEQAFLDALEEVQEYDDELEEYDAAEESH
jgi:type IV secretion system protein VirD4